jgi:hypothetical protein
LLSNRIRIRSLNQPEPCQLKFIMMASTSFHKRPRSTSPPPPQPSSHPAQSQQGYNVSQDAHFSKLPRQVVDDRDSSNDEDAGYLNGHGAGDHKASPAQLLCTLPPTCSPPHQPSRIANSAELEKHYALYHAHVCEVDGCGSVFPEARLLDLVSVPMCVLT